MAFGYAYPVERAFLGVIDDSAAEEGRAEDEEEVGEDGSEEGPLEDFDLVILEGKQCDYELGDVPTGRVQEPTNCTYGPTMRFIACL